MSFEAPIRQKISSYMNIAKCIKPIMCESGAWGESDAILAAEWCWRGVCKATMCIAVEWCWRRVHIVDHV